MKTTIPGRWAKLIAACGGVRLCAERLGCAPTDLYRWGHGMHVPMAPMQTKITRLSKSLGVASPITAAMRVAVSR